MDKLLGTVFVLIMAGWVWHHHSDTIISAFIFVLIIAAIAFGSFLMIKAARGKQERDAEYEANLSLKENQVELVISEARKLGSALPTLVGYANEWLDQAEFEFQDGAFDPFWDALENAVANLVTFQEKIRKIDQKAQEYWTYKSQLGMRRRSFELGTKTIPDVSGTLHRLKSITRTAQKSPNFTSVYHQRNTNKLLQWGFSNLGEAVDLL